MLVFPLVYIVRKFEKEKEDKTMTHNIVKFESGFYGLKVISTGEIINAALKKWDGKNGTNYPYEIISETFEYYQDAQNNVYYTGKNGVDARFWCSGNKLNAHCHRLMQIHARA